MTKPKPWTMIFEESGGYDCMTAAYCIYAANDELVLVVDLANYDGHNANEEAKAIAISIVEANQ